MLMLMMMMIMMMIMMEKKKKMVLMMTMTTSTMNTTTTAKKNMEKKNEQCYGQFSILQLNHCSLDRPNRNTNAVTNQARQTNTNHKAHGGTQQNQIVDVTAKLVVRR